MKKVRFNRHPNKQNQEDSGVYMNPYRKINAMKHNEDDFVPVEEPMVKPVDKPRPIIMENKARDFDDPHSMIDKLIKSRDKEAEPVSKSQQVQETYDNLMFRNEVRENPIATRINKRVMGVEVVNLNKFINLQLWKRSIYVTDKLIRLVASARLEFLKRYLSKKRHVPMNMIYILIIIFGVVIAIVVILFLLPNLGVM